MRFDDAAQAWRDAGFVILPGYLTGEDLAPALDELELCFPAADGFHSGSDRGATGARRVRLHRHLPVRQHPPEHARRLKTF